MYDRYNYRLKKKGIFMDTVSETVSKVDEGLQEMGIDGVKDSLKDLLNFKQYMENQVPAVMGFLY